MSFCSPPSVGDDVATPTVDSAAVFLYTLFSSDIRWSREHAEKVRKRLGPFPASAANRACESVKKILTLAPDRTSESDNTTTGDSPLDKELKKEFGHNIPFSSPRNLLEHVVVLPKKKDGDACSKAGGGSCEAVHDSLSEDEAVENDAFSKVFVNGMAAKGRTSTHDRTKSKVKSSVDTAVAAAMATTDPTPYSSEWLVQQLQTCSGGGWHNVYMAVFELLSSPQDSAVIQNDVRHTGL